MDWRTVTDWTKSSYSGNGAGSSNHGGGNCVEVKVIERTAPQEASSE